MKLDSTYAACLRRGIPTSVFFYEERFVRSTAPYVAAREKARAVCATCPIRQACGEYALVTNQTGGMWGGLTPGQRRLERRRRFQIAQLVLEPRTLQVTLGTTNHSKP